MGWRDVEICVVRGEVSPLRHTSLRRTPLCGVQTPPRNARLSGIFNYFRKSCYHLLVMGNVVVHEGADIQKNAVDFMIRLISF